MNGYEWLLGRKIMLLLKNLALTAMAIPALAFSAAAQTPIDVSNWNVVLEKAKQEATVVVQGAPNAMVPSLGMLFRSNIQI